MVNKKPTLKKLLWNKFSSVFFAILLLVAIAAAGILVAKFCTPNWIAVAAEGNFYIEVTLSALLIVLIAGLIAFFIFIIYCITDFIKGVSKSYYAIKELPYDKKSMEDMGLNSSKEFIIYCCKNYQKATGAHSGKQFFQIPIEYADMMYNNMLEVYGDISLEKNSKKQFMSDVCDYIQTGYLRFSLEKYYGKIPKIDELGNEIES